MRLMSVLLLMILLSYSPIQVCALCPTGTGGVNPLYDPSVMPDSDFYVSSMVQKANSQPTVSLGNPATNSKSLINPNSTITNQTINNNSSQIEASPEVKFLDVSGKWSVKFNESLNRSLDLILFGKDRVMGSGTLLEDGSKIPLTASGSATEKEIILTAKTVVGQYVNQIDRECDLDLFMANNTLSGSYILKSGGKFLGKGNATAAKY